MLKHYKKRIKNDCGICALSTLAGVDYEFLRPLENEGRTSSCWFMMFGASFLTGKKYYRTKKTGIFEQVMAYVDTSEPIILNTRYTGYNHFVVVHEGIVYDSELDAPQSVKEYERKNWEILEIIRQRVNKTK